MTELWPFSLNKIISKVLCRRLKVLLPKSILDTQTTFVS